jgi:myo-inositol-1(or 4)-monophosphatase
MTRALKIYLDFAIETAEEAGKLTLEYAPSDLHTSMKGDGSPVTEIDKKVEEFIRRRIESKFPHHSIVGEEFGADADERMGYRWFIDPIDGTRYFIRGVPLFSMIIGLEIDGVMQVGLLYFPALGEMLTAASGLGCQYNGQPAQVSSIQALEDSIVAFSDILNFKKYGKMAAFERISSACHYRVGWSDGYGYLMAATGRIDMMFEAVVSVWDVAPYAVIFREAGGYFGDWHGNETIYAQQALACNRYILPQILELLNEG